jgi:hypothetical protein
MKAPPEVVDILYGVKDIAEHLGLTSRQVEHRILRGSIPTFKIGRTVCSTRSGLRDHFNRLIMSNVAPPGSSGKAREDDDPTPEA